jgi:hypothetical protein
MRTSGHGFAKAELFLIALAALCLVGAAVALIVQRTEPVATTLLTSEQAERSVPLPAGPRKNQ